MYIYLVQSKLYLHCIRSKSRGLYLKGLVYSVIEVSCSVSKLRDSKFTKLKRSKFDQPDKLTSYCGP